jgi:uncharacterized membrane protein YcaP (DUF421 family)
MFFEFEPLDTVFRAFLLSVLAVSWVIVGVRAVGLRTFSKMTAFDFVVTIAVGSLLAGAAQSTTWTAFVQSALAISTLLGFQYLVAVLRRSSKRFEAIVQNRPVLLMWEGEMLPAALEATRVAQSDVLAKLREANVLDFSEVRAVVLETTGDISVLHGSTLQDRLVSGIKKVG